MLNRRNLLGISVAASASSMLPALARTASYQPLSKAARSKGLRFGCAVSQATLSDTRYRQLVLDHVDTLVGENAFKWRHLEHLERSYAAEEARWLSDFASAHSRRLRGHCFLWNHHRRMPAWLLSHVTDLTARDTQELTRHMWRHGAYLARHFPHIDCWDAMNEAVNPSTGELRETHFTRLLGNRFFDLAFRILNERMPSARLVYNETMGWEQNGAHRNGVLRLLERALVRDLPIGALGIQSHIGKTLGRPRDELAWRGFLEEVEGMGIDVLVTEFDCSDKNIASLNVAQRDAEVAAHCKGYLDITLSFTNVREVILWSLSDLHSYMNRNSYPEHRRRSDGRSLRGHPFDEGLNPKPMFQAVLGAFNSAPVRPTG